MTSRLKWLSRSGHFGSGNGRYYLRHPSGRVHPMPDAAFGSAEFTSAYERAISLELAAEWDTNPAMKALFKCFCRARSRARRRGVTFQITFQDVQAIWVRQKGVCAMTSMAFDVTLRGGRRRPWAPSLDQITAGFGYVPSNTRIVTAIVNLARGDFADDEFAEMCSLIAKHNKNGKFPT